MSLCSERSASVLLYKVLMSLVHFFHKGKPMTRKVEGNIKRFEISRNELLSAYKQVFIQKDCVHNLEDMGAYYLESVSMRKQYTTFSPMQFQLYTPKTLQFSTLPFPSSFLDEYRESMYIMDSSKPSYVVWISPYLWFFFFEHQLNSHSHQSKLNSFKKYPARLSKVRTYLIPAGELYGESAKERKVFPLSVYRHNKRTHLSSSFAIPHCFLILLFITLAITWNH